MHVVGFTFIRNAIKYDYPIVESILSILPICDEFVVAVGQSDDDTLSFIKNINSPKITIIETVWDDSLREGGRVLAVETDKAFQSIGQRADWCFYLQGDEVIHQKYHDTILQGMNNYKDDPAIDGLLFHYKHFYGSYDFVAASSKWYRHEIRIVKNNKNIFSYRDAQGFRKDNNTKLTVKLLDAYVYHYGWVKAPSHMQAKQKTFQKLWHSDDWVDKFVSSSDTFDYSEVDIVERFDGDHPAVMQSRIKRLNWSFDRDISQNKWSIKESVKSFAKRYLGVDFSYKNYILK